MKKTTTKPEPPKPAVKVGMKFPGNQAQRMKKNMKNQDLSKDLSKDKK